jgi:hypothetical protein
VKQIERDAILREGVSRVETPSERRMREGLEEDVLSLPLRGLPLPLRLRDSRPSAEGYLTALGGPLAYMIRLREIDALTAMHIRVLEERWVALARVVHDPASFPARWRAEVEATRFDEVNDLIERHNRWYPIEARLPMDPRRGDYALVNGKDYRRAPLDADWALERFPPEHAIAVRA